MRTTSETTGTMLNAPTAESYMSQKKKKTKRKGMELVREGGVEVGVCCSGARGKL